MLPRTKCGIWSHPVHHLNIIPVDSLLKMMSNVSRLNRCEIKLPRKLQENDAKESPYGLITRAVDHLVRDMLEDLLAIRNHRLQCLETTQLLAKNGGKWQKKSQKCHWALPNPNIFSTPSYPVGYR